MKLLFVQQAFGLGDIIFTQTIAHDFMSEGYKVLWPVQPWLVEGCARAYPEIMFCDVRAINPDTMENKNLYEDSGVRYLPIRFAEWIMHRPYALHMVSKYEFLEKDWRRWRDYAMPVRDLEKEKQLMWELDIDEDEEFNFINNSFGEGGKWEIPMKADNDLRNVYLAFMPNYSLFDWCGIIERAKTIHAVSTSTLYLFEILNLQAREVHLYTRQPIERDFNFVRFLFSRNHYKLHE